MCVMFVCMLASAVPVLRCVSVVVQLFNTPPHPPPLAPQERLPLAVVGSNTIIEVNGKRVRGRQYPWGVAEGERSSIDS